MSRGRRYEEPKLNMKKVFAVIIAIIVIIMCVVMIKGILDRDKEQGKIASKNYFAAYQNNKWGVIDSEGNIVIDPSYAEMIIVPNSKEDVFLCTYDVDYDAGTYKTKALNSKNEEIFTDYSQIEAISNTDENNNLWYETNILRVEKDGKYGLIDLSGKTLLECEYDEITALDGSKGILKISKDGNYGVVGEDGKILIPAQYANIENLDTESKVGFVVQNEEGKYGIVDYSNATILEPQYDEITKVYGSDNYVVKQTGKEIIVKKDGTEVLNNSDYDSIPEVLKNTENDVIYKKQDKFGVMKLSGEITIDAEYEDLKESKSGILIAKKDGKYGVIDISKNQKVEFKYNSIFYNEKADLYVAEDEEFNNEIINNTFAVQKTGILLDLDDEKGYIKLREGEETKYYNFKFEERKESDIFTSNTLFISKKDGKYGFVDKEGNVVVDYIYDDATQQNEYGFAGVKKDGKWGVVDKQGKLLQEPTYDLSDYLTLDFIGRWHLGKDLNMNYYNQL